MRELRRSASRSGPFPGVSRRPWQLGGWWRNPPAGRETLPVVLVNAVYHPLNLTFLPETIGYFSSLGLRQIYLNPDFSAPWTAQVAGTLPNVYQEIGDLYAEYYLQGDPHFISLIDSKIAVILRGGYKLRRSARWGSGSCLRPRWPCLPLRTPGRLRRNE